MKKTRVAVCCLLAVAGLAGLVTAEEQVWFDVGNCAFCKHLGQEKGMLQNLRWETHLIEKGALTITQVPDEYKEAFDRAQEHMQDTAAKMQAGETMHVCGFCQSHGELMMAGINIESIDSDVVIVTLMTSDDEELVARIHAHAEKTMAAYKAWVAEGAKG